MPSQFLIILLIGVGDVALRKWMPAIDQLRNQGYDFRAHYVDVKPVTKLPTGTDFILVSENPNLAVRELADNGVLGPHTLAIIATPTSLHWPVARSLAPVVGKVLMEKPLAATSAALTGASLFLIVLSVQAGALFWVYVGFAQPHKEIS